MDYVRWKRSNTLSVTAPRNSSIWNSLESDILANSVQAKGKRRRSELQGSRAANWQSASSRRNPDSLQDPPIQADIADKLTSLPLPGDKNPLAVLAEASATVAAQDGNPAVSPVDSDRQLFREDAEDYYARLDRTLKDEAPHIMTLINVDEAERLFSLYFTYLHPHLPVLDPAHSSPSAVARRNNFLFNAICCASAKARDRKLWSRLAEFARFEMERLPKEKNIDVIQGHMIYVTWNLHRPKHFELDMTWLRIGLAVRTAIDINLHRIAMSSQARAGLPWWVMRAILRTWLVVYISDQTMSAQLGKQGITGEESSISTYIDLLRKADTEHSSTSPCLDDLWIAALAEWTQMLSSSIHRQRSSTLQVGESQEGVSKTNVETVSVALDQAVILQLRDWRKRTEESVRDCYNSSPSDPSVGHHKLSSLSLPFTMANIRLYQQYAELVVHSLSLDRVSGSSKGDLPVTVIESSFDAVDQTRLGCPDMIHTFVTYAAVSILRLIQPLFSRYSSHPDDNMEIAQLAADMLDRASPDRTQSSFGGHGPFLKNLIRAKKTQIDALRVSKVSNGHGSRTSDEGRGVHDQTQDVSDIAATLSFEMFGSILDRDQGQSIWPPVPDTSLESLDSYVNLLFPSYGSGQHLDL
uniref:Transcription factor domain-containing protein n=1 Tax=Kwoniella bestiolae CBS 10118 TaxID=1296100 RepID=A0A1B9FTF4_9TREE|nr:hypothetical protein I302_08835 [Kwoniella bestiolae CBS 10118]OCF22054.1 hypothetical protein I302_08835 [Kwoniella bestiolae CBS 10118]